MFIYFDFQNIISVNRMKHKCLCKFQSYKWITARMKNNFAYFDILYIIGFASLKWRADKINIDLLTLKNLEFSNGPIECFTFHFIALKTCPLYAKFIQLKAKSVEYFKQTVQWLLLQLERKLIDHFIRREWKWWPTRCITF